MRKASVKVGRLLRARASKTVYRILRPHPGQSTRLFSKPIDAFPEQGPGLRVPAHVIVDLELFHHRSSSYALPRIGTSLPPLARTSPLPHLVATGGILEEVASLD